MSLFIKELEDCSVSPNWWSGYKRNRRTIPDVYIQSGAPAETSSG